MLEVLVTAIIAVGSLAPFAASSLELAKNLPPVPDPATITCHNKAWEDTNLLPVNSTRLQTRFAPFVDLAISDAQKDGIYLLVNSGYRTCPEQQKLRISACGVGNYNLYQKPIDLCFPPTEPAGHSMHNEGLAVDFACSGYGLFESSPCYAWMTKNGSKYHLFRHRLEGWHWSTTGQ